MKYAAILKFVCASVLMAFSLTNSNAQSILTTWVGSGVAGYSGDSGLANMAQLNHPYGITFDAAGNFYIADQGNYAIRRVDAVTGIITTIAGNGAPGYAGDGGPATAAMLGAPYGICIDASNNLYITDWTSSVVRKINTTTGTITTFAGNGMYGSSGDGGAATSAQLSQPEGLCIYGGYLYITDKIANCVRKVNLTTGIITAVAGTGSYDYTGDGGPATAGTLRAPSAICADTHGNLYIADEENKVIRKITAASGFLSTVVGTGVYGFGGNGGPATSATIGFIQGVCIDQHGDIYINDASCSCRKIKASTGIITLVAGSDTVDGYGGDGGDATAGLLNNPTGGCIDPVTGTIVIADFSNMRIRRATQPDFFPTKTTNIVAQSSPFIYPNPSAGSFFIQVPDNGTYSWAEVYSLSGEKIYSTLLKDNTTRIDLSNGPSGNYIVNVHSFTGNSFTQKIIITPNP